MHLAVLVPQVAPQPHQGRHAQHGQGDSVLGADLGLGGLGVVAGLAESGLLLALELPLVHLGPLRPHGPQQQPGHHPLPFVQAGERPDAGDQWVGARVQQVVVLEGAQRRVLRAGGPQRHAPGQLALRQPQGVVLRGHGRDAGLGVAGGDLTPYHLVVQAAGQQGDAARVPGQFQGEGLGDGDGGQQVLHPQKGALPRCGAA